ncbi:MAG: heavy-metal-associated domain-containing protein [Gammaproteobacteria bacterium]|nr:heavy-metal-associated domain-containing protein [Gammaproteobacteria bacterium]
MTTFNIIADKIKCGGCATIIKDGLTKMSEVESVDVNVETGEVIVTANNIEQALLEQKLNELGYPAK